MELEDSYLPGAANIIADGGEGIVSSKKVQHISTSCCRLATLRSIYHNHDHQHNHHGREHGHRHRIKHTHAKHPFNTVVSE